MLENLPGMHWARGPIPTTAKEKNGNKERKGIKERRIDNQLENSHCRRRGVIADPLSLTNYSGEKVSPKNHSAQCLRGLSSQVGFFCL